MVAAVPRPGRPRQQTIAHLLGGPPAAHLDVPGLGGIEGEAKRCVAAVDVAPLAAPERAEDLVGEAVYERVDLRRYVRHLVRDEGDDRAGGSNPPNLPIERVVIKPVRRLRGND